MKRSKEQESCRFFDNVEQRKRSQLSRDIKIMISKRQSRISKLTVRPKRGAALSAKTYKIKTKIIVTEKKQNNNKPNPVQKADLPLERKFSIFF